MRTLAKTAVTLGFLGATAIGTTATIQAQGYYGYHGYGYYPGADPNGCPPGYSLQGGNCAPYKGPSGPGVPRGARFPWQ